MHAAGTAERDEGELARVKAPLDTDHPQRSGHLGLRDLDDAGGRLLRGQPQLVAQPLQGLPREVRGQHDLPAEGRAVGQVAEQQVRVGDGRLVATETVGRRARIRPGRTGTDPQRATLVGPATEPPPALTEWTSTAGSLIGTPASTDSVVVCTAPPTTAATSVLVPPMSKVSRSPKPDRAAM